MKNKNSFYENLTNLYSVSKTIRMELKPVGKTAENMAEMILEDEQRAEDYKKAKKILDKVHIKYIDECMEKTNLVGLEKYESAFSNKDNSDELDNIKKELRKQIKKAMPNPVYFNLKNYDIILDFLENEEEKEAIKKFNKFFTYFVGYNEVRENVYTDEEIPTAVSYRLINDNLPKFINNKRIVEKAIEKIGKSELNNVIYENGLEDFITDVEELTNIEFFNKTLSQRGIDKYNILLGGKSEENDIKIKGLNEIINLYNQQTKDRIGKLSPLFKQILSERIGVSFIPEKFNDDNEIVESLRNFYMELDRVVLSKNNENDSSILDLFENIDKYDLSGIFVKNDSFITQLSQKLTGDWSYINSEIIKEYDDIKQPKKITESYQDKRKKDLKKIKEYSFEKLNFYLKEFKVEEYYKKEIEVLTSNIINLYKDFESYKTNKKIISDDEYINRIKNLCDEIKNLQKIMKTLNVSVSNVDSRFYGDFNTKWEFINTFTLLYNKIRNYMTKKPYSTEKYKLTFNRSDFMNGWGQDYGTKEPHLFEYNGLYYLGVVDKKLARDDIEKVYGENGDCIHYGYNFQKPDMKNVPRIFIRSKGDRFAPNVEKYNLPVMDIIDIYDKGEFKTEFRNKNPEKYKESLEKIIDYFKLGFSRDENYRDFDLKWKESKDYNNISEFYNDVIYSCYKLKEEKVVFSELERLVEEGKLYLFKIYNKDFSEYSKGKPNLHTLYFKMLFDEENIKNPIYKLSGGAEMFFRKRSIFDEEQIVHKANEAINNKNAGNPKKQSVFEYDIIKDRRYTVDKFLLHMSIIVNFQSQETDSLKERVNRYIKYNDDVYAIGIDRGERNLLYACVVDSKGNLVEQQSLNTINGVDYHRILEYREKDRKKEKQEWKAIDNISNLKEGYLSIAIHKIVELMLKYNAVLVLEDLNFGFKQGRQKFERSVYQKFEKMLITKLNFLVDKEKDKNDLAGLFNALQLTDKFESFKKMGKQNGVIFYIPAWMTSKIDPVTGFTNLFYVKYESKEKTRGFISKFENIGYNKTEDYFEFEFDYNDFTERAKDTRSKWTICSYGNRIYTFRNKETNNEFDSKEIKLTEEFKNLFNKFNISLSDNMKEDILNQDTKEFYEEFIKLFKLTVQLRNSITNSDVDYLISPVKDKNGNFFDSRKCSNALPQDADANGAYNIARKGLMYMDIIRKTEDKKLRKPELKIDNKQWLNYVQERDK